MDWGLHLFPGIQSAVVKACRSFREAFVIESSPPKPNPIPSGGDHPRGSLNGRQRGVDNPIADAHIVPFASRYVEDRCDNNRLAL